MNPNFPPIESLDADDGEPQVGSREHGAWNLRKQIPSELVHKPALCWPKDAAEALSIAEPTLKKMRAAGDHPRLYALGRSLFTTLPDLRDWVKGHEVEPGHLSRPATFQRGARRPIKTRKAA